MLWCVPTEEDLLHYGDEVRLMAAAAAAGVISTPRVACVLRGFLRGGLEWRGKEQVTLNCAFLSVKLRVLLHIWNLLFRKDLGCFLLARSSCLTPPARRPACT